MIVKNEAVGIEETLKSVRDHIDRWLVLDTGSTDGTQELVLRTLEGLPGQLIEEQFVDFASTRNRAIELVGPDAEFVLMLSGDETLDGGQALRSFCAGQDGDAFYLRIRGAAINYDSIRLTRTNSAWTYEGTTHERMVHPSCGWPTSRVPGCFVRHVFRYGTNLIGRWKLDLELLNKTLERDPANARAVFYKAQTLTCLGCYSEALELYHHRLSIPGDDWEIYECHVRIAWLLEKLCASPEDIDQELLAAHALSPDRAEPLYEIARRTYDRGDFAKTVEFATRAKKLPLPDCLRLFVQRHVYEGGCQTLLDAATEQLSRSHIP